MHHDRTVIGYHGTDAATANRLLAGAAFAPSANDYDWLGEGVYFWEYAPDRAWRFAVEMLARRRASGRRTRARPAVVGAVIQLGSCFDLLDTRFTSELPESFRAWQGLMSSLGKTPLRNTGLDRDLKLRRLDCAVLDFHFLMRERRGTRYDTVRGAFVEGEPAFPGSMIHRLTHVQVAVRNPVCILGVFRPILDRP